MTSVLFVYQCVVQCPFLFFYLEICLSLVVVSCKIGVIFDNCGQKLILPNTILDSNLLSVFFWGGGEISEQVQNNNCLSPIHSFHATSVKSS